MSPAEINGDERDRSRETFGDEARLRQSGDVDEESNHPRMDERGGEQTPPFAVRRARPEAGAPAEERRLIAQCAGAEEHADEDRHVHGNDRRRDTPSACAREARHGKDRAPRGADVPFRRCARKS